MKWKKENKGKCDSGMNMSGGNGSSMDGMASPEPSLHGGDHRNNV